MDNKTMILNGCNFVGEKVEVNVNEIENKIDTEYLIIKNVDITKEIIEKIKELKPEVVVLFNSEFKDGYEILTGDDNFE